MLSAPLTAGHPNVFVVTVPGTLEVEAYEWRIRRDSDEVAKRRTKVGRLRWIVPSKPNGSYDIEVTLLAAGGSPIETLRLPPMAAVAKPHIPHAEILMFVASVVVITIEGAVASEGQSHAWLWHAG
jgi:hypothetical protein